MPDPSPELRRGRSLKNRSSGAWGEELALRYLTRQGYTLVERNYRTRYGELDLVVRHGTTLVFVEVKLRRGTGFGDPLEAVTHANRPGSAPSPNSTSSIESQPSTPCASTS
jgi:putative endonuclease